MNDKLLLTSKIIAATIILIITLSGAIAAGNLTDGLDLWYSLEENALPLIDSAGHLNITGYNTAEPTYQQTGKVNYGINFTSNGWVRTSAKAGQYGTGNFSVSLWMKPRYNSTYYNALGTDSFNGSSYTGWYVQRENDNQIMFSVRNSTGANEKYCNTSTNTYYGNTWYHVVGVRNGTEIYTYVNGVRGCILTGSTANVDNGQLFKIGQSDNTNTNRFNGSIDEVGVWNKPLTAEEVLELFNGGAGNPYSNWSNQSVPTNYFSITLTDNYTGASINDFTALVNGTYYNTTTGTITTTINQSDATHEIINVTVNATGYFNKTYTSWNSSSDLAATLHATQVTFYAYELWNNAIISNYTVTATNNTATGTGITLNLTTGNVTVTFNKTGYYNLTYTIQNLTALEERSINLSPWTKQLNVSAYNTVTDMYVTAYNFTISNDDTGVNDYFIVNNDTGTPALYTERNTSTDTGSSTCGYILLDDIDVSPEYEFVNISARLRHTTGAIDARVVFNVTYENGTTATQTNQTTNTTYQLMNYVLTGRNTSINNIKFYGCQLGTSGSWEITNKTIIYYGGNNILVNISNGNYTITANDSLHSLTSYNFTLNNTNNTISDYLLLLYNQDQFFLNFYNESDNTALTGVTVYYELISEDETRNGSTTTGNAEETLLIPNPYTINYWYDTLRPRTYYVTLADQSYENISLYLIDYNISTAYTPLETDENDRACSENTISLLRYYIDVNGYRTVAMAKTDTNGYALFYVEPNVINYKLFFEGSCGTYTTVPQKIISSTNSFTVIGAQTYLTSSETIASADISIDYVNTTQTFVLDWLDDSNIITEGCLYVFKQYRGVTTTNYTECSSGSSGSLIYTLSGNLSETIWNAQGVFNTNTTYSFPYVSSDYIDFTTTLQAWGKAGAFWSMIAILAVALMFGNSISTLVLATAGMFIILTISGILPGAGQIVSAIAITGGIILYKIRTT